MKRITSMLLALVILACSVFPALAPVALAEEETTETTAPEAVAVSDESTSGSGYLVDDSSNANANAYWAQVDIYTLFNSTTDGFLLTSSNLRGLKLCLYKDEYYVIQTWGLNNLSPYTSLNYPLGTLVTNANLVSSYGSTYFTRRVFINYNEAYSYWLSTNSECYYLTSNSRICFDVSSTSHTYICSITNVGLISSLGVVSVLASLDMPIYSNGSNSGPIGLYSDVATIPDSTPTVPTVSNSSTTANDYGWNYVEQNSSGPTLSVTAESPNNGTLSYQWYVFDYDANKTTALIGATGSSYTVPTDTVGNYYYTCSVTNTYPTGSNSATVGWAINIFSESQAAGDSVTWTILDDGTLLISGNGMMANYSSSNSVPWYELKESITSIVVSDGITHIGDRAFNGLNLVTSVSLPSSLVSIGKMAFYNTKSLNSLIIPEGVLYIESFAFSGSNVVAVSLPSSLLRLDYSAFSGCAILKILYCYSADPPYNSSATSIFKNNTALTVIYVPYGSGEAYRIHEDWAEVADYIVEMEPEADPVDTIEELNVVVEQILVELDEMNTTQTGLLGQILDAINSWGQAIVDAVGGSFVTDQSADEFQIELDTALGDLSSAGDVMASVERPDYSSIDFNVTNMVPASGLSSVASVVNLVVGNEVLAPMIMVNVILGLASFVIFGRR